MTVTNQLNRATLDGNGLATVVPISFPFHSAEDLVVVQTVLATGTETTKILNTDYTVTGTPDAAGHYPNGGEVVFTAAPLSTVRMTVYRNPPMLQGVVLQETGKIPVKAAIESPLDKLTMISQRLSERVDRALQLSDGDSTPLGRLPAKTVRASRYLGFDGDGNPTMMQTPTAMVTSLAQLAESTVAALPAAGAAGSLRKVTDDARGVWMDTGAAWVPLNKGEINALDFLKGDGTDETTAFQTMVSTGKDICFPRPPVAYGVNGAITLATSNQRFRGFGNGSLIKCLGSGFNLFAPSQDVDGIEMAHLHFQGAATSDATQQYVVFSTSSFQITNSKFLHLTISGPSAGVGFNNGILFDTNSNDNIVAHCFFERLMGTTAGHGYGVQLGSAHRNRILFNRFLGVAGAGRHGVYVGSGSSRNTVAFNQIRDFNSSFIVIYATAAQDTCLANLVTHNSLEGGSTVAPEAAAVELAGDAVQNVIADNLIDGFTPHGILVSDSGQGGLCRDNVVQNNRIRNVGVTGILILGAKDTLVQSNEVSDGSQDTPDTANGITVTSSGSFGTEVADGTAVLNNRVHGSSHRFACSLNSTSPVPTNTVLRGNDLRTGTSGVLEIAGVPVGGDDVVRYSAAYSASITPVAYGYLRTQATISANNNSNFTINAPTNPREGKELVLTIRNTSGGALGTLSFNAVFKVGASWTQPATGNSRSIQFLYDGTNWIETGRTAADVAT